MTTHRFLTWLIVIGLLLPALPAQAQDAPTTPDAPQAYISVNSLGDEADADNGDGICDTTGKRSPATPYSGICTLRAAIQTANNTPAADIIDMRIAGVIQPAADDLPAIYHPVAISGNSTVTLDGSLLPTGTNHAGLQLFENGGGSTIQGLTIRKFSGWGVLVGDEVGGSTIEDNTIRENGMGIQISMDSPTNTVASNVIVLNGGLTGNGITASSNGNTITGNKIGSDGVQDQGNAGHGIRIAGSNNLIGAATGISAGGACTGDCNLIAGNGSSGIEIGQGTDKSEGINNIVRGNFIGVNLVGTAAIPNDDNGITTNGDYNSIIGNLISGNGSADAFDSAHGVYLEAGAIGNHVAGNLIGAAIDGSTPLGNYDAGVYLNFANENIIGADAVAATGLRAVPATCTGDCNVILGNRAGISITQAVSPGLNKIIGNFIGVAADGTPPGNQGNGIFMQGMNMTVAANVIAGNGGNGIEILGIGMGGPLPSNAHIVQGNYIGVGRDGVSQAGNQGHGVFVNRSADNWIGGTADGQGNIIAYNGYWRDSIYDGVVITGTNAVNNRILRNSIVSNGSWLDGQGIDLRDDGPTPNDATDADSGPNNLQNYPVLTRVKGATVTGVLTSTANTTFRLEFFGSPECGPTGYGQGKDFLGSFDVTTDANGFVAFEGTLATAPAGRIVTATATDPAGNTSEFSACYGGLVVNSTGDAQDANPWDGVCNTGATIENGDPECTLRAALQEANADERSSTITFDIPVAGARGTNSAPAIMPHSALPDSTYPVIIDGRTQPGGAVILDGLAAGSDASGLHLRGGNSQVRGLTIVRFSDYGIWLAEWNDQGNNIVAGNWIGVYPDGAPGGNGGAGVFVGSSDNRIGGTTTAERNVIAGNGASTADSGISIASYAANNQIQGNWIGVLPDGTVRGNSLAGIYLDGSPNNVIGGAPTARIGSCSGACNVIGGNRYGVIVTLGTAIANQIRGNAFGLTASGGAAPNTEWGVIIDKAANNVVSQNVVASNGPAGVRAAALTNGDGILLNGSAATGNTVSQNTIGLGPDGAALPNARHGVWVEQAPNNTIVSNVIAGNGGSGVTIHGAAATGNVVHSNRIGVDPLGAAARPNGGDGVTIDAAPGNTVGSASAGQGNLISGNTGNGVQITGDGAQNNIVTGNRIGINQANTAALSNAGDGVRVAGGAASNTIGGVQAGNDDANVIVGNGGEGVQIDGAGTINNVVAGNFIGVLADESTAMANASHGVYISGGANSNTIGAAVAEHANAIARNGGAGIHVALGMNNALWNNRIWRNTLLGIDLGAAGVTPNDPLDPDTGPNLLQNFPLLTAVQFGGDTVTLKGTLESTRTTTFLLEFFGNRECDASGFGEGEIPLGRAEVTTDANGWATFTYIPTATVTSPVSFTVTATDPNRNTSEFSPCAGPSTEAVLTPAGGGSLNTNGVTVTVPAGGVAADVTLALEPLVAPVNVAPDGMGFGGLAFLLNAFVGGAQQQNFAFQQPVRVTVQYSDAAIAGLDENTLTLQYWNGTAWGDAATTCTPASSYNRQPATNQIGVDICHLTPYALMGPASMELYLPVIAR